jgi:hypothetical protein
MKAKGRQKPNCSWWNWFLPTILLLYLLSLWIVSTTITQRQLPSIGISSGSGNDIDIDLHPDFPREPRPRPPLSSIVNGWNITGDPSWLLNLAIVGFPKTGTSTLMKYLHLSPQIQVFDQERCELGYNQHAKLILSLYQDMPPGHYIRAFKCPRDLEVTLALQNYAHYFPHTDFMVGLRHPISWFESFYNFRVNNFYKMPSADQLTGRCTKRHNGLCTFRGNFHLFLANMGKTNITNDPNEQALIPYPYRKFIQPVPLKGRVFLWEISQLQPNNHPRQQTLFRHDLQQFLHLPQPLPEMIWIKPGFDHAHNQTLQHHVQTQKIDICDTQYQPLRQVLLSQAILAAQWIRQYFLNAPGVYVSDREYFVNVILKSWERDPCDEKGVL